jgi:xanthine dehydrogenase small subunit
VTKRRDEDISAVACGFHVALNDGKVATARLAFGGMAATPKRAAAVEAALVGQPWTLETVTRAEAKFAEDFTPLTDWRASADYRALVARNLLRRFYLESTGETAQLKREVAV